MGHLGGVEDLDFDDLRELRYSDGETTTLRQALHGNFGFLGSLDSLWTLRESSGASGGNVFSVVLVWFLVSALWAPCGRLVGACMFLVSALLAYERLVSALWAPCGRLVGAL